MNFNQKHREYVQLIEERLAQSIPEYHPYCAVLKEAMAYSLMAGGKRLRPVLALAVAEMFDYSPEEVINFACSIEMIHTYSLIHDDLPAMDDDDYRRGRATNHKVYGEAMAILAGDALLNLSYENMIRDTLASGNNHKVKAMGIVAECAGAFGMIGGQVIDLESEGKKADAEKLRTMHRLKTGALIKAPVEAAAVICGASQAQIDRLSDYAVNLGVAFQIKDDILDVEGNMDSMGKKPGSDLNAEKTTYVTMFGLETSKKMLGNVTQEGVASLETFGAKADFLRELALSLVNRDR